jgi:hypothetical protein
VQTDLQINARILWKKISDADYVILDNNISEFSPSKIYVRLGSEWVLSSNVVILEIL